jgi:hypothetical protein
MSAFSPVHALPERAWDGYLEGFHAGRPETTESVLRRARAGGTDPYGWLAEVVPPTPGSWISAAAARPCSGCWQGIDVRTGTPAAGVSHDGRQFTVSLDGEKVTADRLLVAAGRRTRLAALGVAALGLDAAARTVSVDDRMRAAAGLWAIGDITGVSAHTHMAMYQADIAVRDILGTRGPAADYRAAPAVTFSDPEVGQAGLTEAQARQRGDRRAHTGITQVPSSARGWIHKAGNDGFIKLVADAGPAGPPWPRPRCCSSGPASARHRAAAAWPRGAGKESPKASCLSCCPRPGPPNDCRQYQSLHDINAPPS